MTIYDLHCHSTFSDGVTSIEYLMEKAAGGGYKTGIADHLFCEKNETLEDITRYLDHACSLGIPVGGEANIDLPFDMPDRMLNRFDYIVASVHQIITEDAPFIFGRWFAMRCGIIKDWPGYNKGRAYEYLNTAYKMIKHHMETYPIDILGHCCAMPCYDDVPYWSREMIDWENDIIALCKKHNVAMEITSMFCSPYERMLRNAKKEGIKFSFASDAHRLEDIGNLKYSIEMAELLELTDDNLFLPKHRG
ncbi:MAG: PHP domain-containing protein [Eubacteriales bacterium]|nr:PHP domain-containing protein [Eubacteriales bacterium]